MNRPIHSFLSWGCLAFAFIVGGCDTAPPSSDETDPLPRVFKDFDPASVPSGEGMGAGTGAGRAHGTGGGEGTGGGGARGTGGGGGGRHGKGNQDGTGGGNMDGTGGGNQKAKEKR